MPMPCISSNSVEGASDFFFMGINLRNFMSLTNSCAMTFPLEDSSLEKRVSE
jgi:hypothetical protein